jgi:hypothetical protein
MPRRKDDSQARIPAARASLAQTLAAEFSADKKLVHFCHAVLLAVRCCYCCKARLCCERIPVASLLQALPDHQPIMIQTICRSAQRANWHTSALTPRMTNTATQQICHTNLLADLQQQQHDASETLEAPKISCHHMRSHHTTHGACMCCRAASQCFLTKHSKYNLNSTQRHMVQGLQSVQAGCSKERCRSHTTHK